jgi:hypothetical protein
MSTGHSIDSIGQILQERLDHYYLSFAQVRTTAMGLVTLVSAAATMSRSLYQALSAHSEAPPELLETGKITGTFGGVPTTHIPL